MRERGWRWGWGKIEVSWDEVKWRRWLLIVDWADWWWWWEATWERKHRDLIEYPKTFNATQPQLRSPPKRGSRLQTEDEPPQGVVNSGEVHPVEDEKSPSLEGARLYCSCMFRLPTQLSRYLSTCSIVGRESCAARAAERFSGDLLQDFEGAWWG